MRCFDWFISLWSSAKIRDFAYLLFKPDLQRVSLVWTRTFSNHKRNLIKATLSYKMEYLLANRIFMFFPVELILNYLVGLWVA